jgi:hypothetical protein
MSEAITINLTEPKEEITFTLTDQKEEVVFSFSEAARGPQGEPGESASVTNAAVNAAIEDDPSATRTSLELGTAALSDTGTGASNVILGNDARLTDARTPTSHASSHVTGGTDKIRDASAAQDGLMTTAFAAKLNGIEAGADVTDSANVNAAGAVMESDYSPAHSILVQQSGTGSPSSLSIGNNTLVGRLSGGGSNIDDLSASQVRTLLNVEDGADVTDAANVNAAIATNPSASRTSLDIALRGEDYGIIPTTSTDEVAEANATALATAYAASVSTGKPLILKGTIYVKGQVFLSGIYGKIIGYGCTIIQKDTAHNGLTLAADSGVPPFGIIIQGIKIQGQGAATHNAAGIHLRKADLTYVTSDINLIDVQITAFRKGCDIAGVAKFRTENLSITGVRNGCVFNHLQTTLMTNTRISQGDSNAASSCFEIETGTMFSFKVLMGEFGGSGIARFANIAGTSVMFHVEAANLEAFTSNQIVNSLVGAHISLIDCRFAQTFTSTQAIISSQVNSGTDVCRVRLENPTQFGGTPRFVEVYGTHSATAGVFNMGDERFDATFAATQGGSAEKTVSIFPSVRNFTLTSSFPVSGAIAGDKINYSPLTATDTDGWSTNYLFRCRNNNTGSNEWTSLNNNMLMRVLGVSARTASGNNVETDIQNVTLPIGALRNNGESVEIELFGSTAANANNKQFRFYFGGSQYFDFGLIAINNQSWTLKIKIQRGAFSGGTGFMKLVGVLDYGTGKVIRTAETPNGTIDSSSTIATRTTVLTPSAASDAVSLAAKTVWHRAVTAI